MALWMPTSDKPAYAPHNTTHFLFILSRKLACITFNSILQLLYSGPNSHPCFFGKGRYQSVYDQPGHRDCVSFFTGDQSLSAFAYMQLAPFLLAPFLAEHPRDRGNDLGGCGWRNTRFARHSDVICEAGVFQS
ncbi:hypothetical protein D3C85_1560550 [compost metagenome]